MLYTELDREIAAIGPVCELSGRCCRFLEYGHTLFISTAEVQYLVGSAPPPERPLDSRRDLPVAGFARPLHRQRRPAAGLPHLLLRPLLSGRSPPAFRAFYRSHEEVVLRPWDSMELRSAPSPPGGGAKPGPIPSESFLTLL